MNNYIKEQVDKVEEGVSDIQSTLQDSGDRRVFDSGAVRDMGGGKGRCDLLPACAILRLARVYESGATKYDERNWEKGIPVHSFIDSGLRHLLSYLDGLTDEDHLAQAAWNILGAMWTEEKRPYLQDIPCRQTTAPCLKEPDKPDHQEQQSDDC